MTPTRAELRYPSSHTSYTSTLSAASPALVASDRHNCPLTSGDGHSGVPFS